MVDRGAKTGCVWVDPEPDPVCRRGRTMFGWLRKRRDYRRGYKRGQDLSKKVTAVIEAHIEGRVLPAAERLIQAFQERLGTVFDDPAANPRLKGSAEWQVFEEYLTSEFAVKMRAELNAAISKWEDIFDARNVRALTDCYICTKLDYIVSDTRLKAASLIPFIVEEIERREAAASAKGSA
jgi:hypothetical protein